MDRVNEFPLPGRNCFHPAMKGSKTTAKGCGVRLNDCRCEAKSMLFRRRKPEDLWVRMRTIVWPRRSFWRSSQYYIKRVLRLTATPHSIAAGVAAGVFMSFTPLLGLHILISAALAWLIRGNLVAAAIGTTACNPLTVPLMWGASLEIGRFILYGRNPGEPSDIDIGSLVAHFDLTQLWGPVLKPLTVGCIPLGLAFALLFYGLTRWAVVAFREQRRRRLAERARRRVAARNYGANAAAG